MANTSAAPKSQDLFPMLPHPQPRPQRGVAKLAQQAVHAGDGHLVEFRLMEARSILNRSESKRGLRLAYGINPYRGCEFGCKYCYARYTHEFLAPVQAQDELSPEQTPNATSASTELSGAEAFERIIFLKKNAAWLLEQELRRVDGAEEIALGTATDPYQPIERTARITRSLLEVFARRSGLRLGIITKSTLIQRDIDLLVEIGRRNTLVLHQTITTADIELARKLEPRAPRPDLRFATVRRLRQAGLRVGILCSPLLPGLTDTEEAIDGMAQRASAVDASFFAAQPLFLKPCSRPTYLSFVREHFPSLETDYAERFATADFAARPYRERLSTMVAQACRRYGIPERSSDALLTADQETARKGPAASSLPGHQHLLFA